LSGLIILYSLGECQGALEAKLDKADGVEMASYHLWVRLLVLDLILLDLDHSLVGLVGLEEAGAEGALAEGLWANLIMMSLCLPERVTCLCEVKVVESFNGCVFVIFL